MYVVRSINNLSSESYKLACGTRSPTNQIRLGLSFRLLFLRLALFGTPLLHHLCSWKEILCGLYSITLCSPLDCYYPPLDWDFVTFVFAVIVYSILDLRSQAAGSLTPPPQTNQPCPPHNIHNTHTKRNATTLHM
jgi:hypothetical protein